VLWAAACWSQVAGVEKLGWIMIDKSKAEMTALESLAQRGLLSGYLLCIFHMLQGGRTCCSSCAAH